MMLSNPLDESGQCFFSTYHSRSEVLGEKPSKKSGNKADDAYKFQKLLDQFDLPIWEENSEKMKARVRDWYALSSSFVHADTFSSDLASQILCDPKLKQDLLFEIYLDVTELLTDLFTGTVFHLLEELKLHPNANGVRNSRQNFFAANHQ
jgi:hypothetical protein